MTKSFNERMREVNLRAMKRLWSTQTALFVRLSEPRRRCRALVLHRDQYRRTGRGPGGFSLHYTEAQCKREAAGDSSYCWQHGGERQWATLDYKLPQEFL